jgi:hypothetical protein
MSIIITAMDASEPIKGLISVNFGKPALLRMEVKDLKTAIETIKIEHTRLVNGNINHQIFATCYGKKPRGWNQSKQLLRKDFIREV